MEGGGGSWGNENLLWKPVMQTSRARESGKPDVCARLRDVISWHRADNRSGQISTSRWVKSSYYMECLRYVRMVSCLNNMRRISLSLFPLALQLPLLELLTFSAMLGKFLNGCQGQGVSSKRTLTSLPPSELAQCLEQIRVWPL